MTYTKDHAYEIYTEDLGNGMIAVSMQCCRCREKWYMGAAPPGGVDMLKKMHDTMCPSVSKSDKFAAQQKALTEDVEANKEAAAAITAVRTFDPDNALLEDEAEFLKMREQVVKELEEPKPPVWIGDPPESLGTSSNNIPIVPSPYQSTTGGCIYAKPKPAALTDDDGETDVAPEPFPEDEEPVHVVPAKKVKPIKPSKGRRVLG